MRLAFVLAFTAVVCGLVYFVFSHPGLERLEKLERELGELEVRNEALAEENEELERQIVALREDPRLAERRARESVGMARPDELVFQFDEADENHSVRVWLKVEPEAMELAGRPVEIEELAGELESLHRQIPGAHLEVTVDEEVGPIQKQQVVDIVEESPLAVEDRQD